VRASHWVLAAAALPFFVAFGWQDGIATIADDSVSYLALARWLSGDVDGFLAPWLYWHTHFPPLFPMALAATGGARDPAIAHLVVAAFAAAGVFAVARYAALRLHSDAAGLGIALAFLALPTAWISVKGILSESMFLVVSLAALHVHDRWVARAERPLRTALVFGLLLAAALLTRAAAVTLVAAYVARAAVEFAANRERRAGLWLPLLPPALLVAAWIAVRPGGHTYDQTIGGLVAAWLRDPVLVMSVGAASFFDGWVASFMAQGDVMGVPRVVFAAFGLVALGGALRAAARNRLDGWYALFTVGLTLVWVFSENNMRRLLYPIVPLALLHATEAIVAATRGLAPRPRRLVFAAACALPLLLCIPATALVAQKSLDRTPLVPGSRYAAADITEYYTVVNVVRARALAAKHAAVLAGLDRLTTDTPPGARIMWMRPEYIALLGHRAGVPYYFGWDGRRMAREVRDSRTDFIIVAGMYKSDLDMRAGDAAVTLREIAPYATPRTVLVNAVTGENEYMLMQVHPGALEAYLEVAPDVK
jgi:hypothetical protein